MMSDLLRVEETQLEWHLGKGEGLDWNQMGKEMVGWEVEEKVLADLQMAVGENWQALGESEWVEVVRRRVEKARLLEELEEVETNAEERQQQE